MFHISVTELGIVCALALLAFIIPLIITRGYARLSRRLKDLEDKVEKKR